MPQSDPSCELGGVTSWTDVYTTPYVWNAQTKAWVLGTETGPTRADEKFTAYTDAEYQRLCGGDQPDPKERRVPQSEASCDLGGVTSWNVLHHAVRVGRPDEGCVLGDETSRHGG